MSVDNMDDYWCGVYEGQAEEYEQYEKWKLCSFAFSLRILYHGCIFKA